MKHPFVKPHDVRTGFITSDYPASAYDGSRAFCVGTCNTPTEGRMRVHAHGNEVLNH